MGRAVLSAVLTACEAFGVRQVVAVIGDSENAARTGAGRCDHNSAAKLRQALQVRYNKGGREGRTEDRREQDRIALV